VQVVDPRTLRLTLAHPAPYLPTLLAHPVWYPVHLPALEKAGGVALRDTRWTDPANFVGNGPFVLKAWRRGDDLRAHTVAYDATKTAADIDRELVATLAAATAEIHVTIEPVSGAAEPGALFIVSLPTEERFPETPDAFA